MVNGIGADRIGGRKGGEEMRHIVIDLEMTSIVGNGRARRVCRMETIEIGAVMLDENLREINSFRRYVRPQCTKDICRFYTELTGIGKDRLAGAPHFEAALRDFAAWCTGDGSDYTVYAWSETDRGQICREMRLKEIAADPELARMLENWVNLQKRFKNLAGMKQDPSLEKSLAYIGLAYQGDMHDALCDARNTAELLRETADEEEFHRNRQRISERMEEDSEDFCCGLGSMFDFAAMGFYIGM